MNGIDEKLIINWLKKPLIRSGITRKAEVILQWHLLSVLTVLVLWIPTGNRKKRLENLNKLASFQISLNTAAIQSLIPRVVCCCSAAKLRLIVCSPMDCSTPGFPVHHHLLEFCSNSWSIDQWCHPTISFSVVPFSSCLQYFPASGSFPMSWLFTSGGQSKVKLVLFKNCMYMLPKYIFTHRINMIWNEASVSHNALCLLVSWQYSSFSFSYYSFAKLPLLINSPF